MLTRDPASTVVAVDYDGTLAPIVDDPAIAFPAPGASDVLAELTTHFRRVLVVSGRPASFLANMVLAPVNLVGLYGLEGLDVGERWEHPNGGAWREVMADLAAHADAHGPAGMRTELKGLSITFHYREHPEIADAVETFTRKEAATSGLSLRPARMSVELHPPIDVDKGTVIERAADGARAVVFVGDDVGDLTGFDALDRLAARGVSAVRIAVRSAESPPALLERADVLLDGPPEVVDFLAYLAASAAASASSASAAAEAAN